MTAARRGPLVAGTWLIGLGVVFIIQTAMGWGWGEAWPLFVILAGVAGLVTTAIDGVHGFGGIWAFTWPIVTIVVGILFLLGTTGQLGATPFDLLAQWWPVGLVVLGVWFLIGALIPGQRPQEQLVVPLTGTGNGSVRIQFGAGELRARRSAAGTLVDGSFEGGVVKRDLGPGRIELKQDTSSGMPWLDKRSSWDVGLSGEVPLDLDIQTGAAKALLDLADLQARNVKIQTGASETRIRLPRAAGMTNVQTNAGAASLTIEVPEGVAARIRTRIGLGSSDIDERRFPRSLNGYESPDFATAANKADIDIQGGVGSVRVVGVA
ncbi:MAG TPA: DUF5668 domain-containing protein [Candidatus Limnocylindrales bacterium]